ncbi:hypothetical protein, partial [Helicobacter sp. 11S02596-1]|uniref:hypothetical protein n=1 Tax=Helicobacter sp. 11S02596-1 TaxID=1476194 RepID=UPI0015DDBA93
LESPTTQKSQKTRDLKTSQQVQNLKDFQIRSFDKLQNSRHRYGSENSQRFQPAKDLKNLKKSSFKPLFSIILASVMGAGVAYATGDASCTLGDANACLSHTIVGSKYYDEFNLIKQDGTTDVWKYDVATSKHKEIIDDLTITGNKAVIIEPNLSIENNTKMTGNFKDSVFVGNFSHNINTVNYTAGEVTLTFDGAYKGNTDQKATINGKEYSTKEGKWAFLGNLNYRLIKNDITFKNGANMAGDIIEGHYIGNVDDDNINITFDNSNLIGNISVNNGENTFTFNNNAHMQGNITYYKFNNEKANLTIKTKDSSIEGNLSVSGWANNHWSNAKANTKDQKITLEFDGNGKEGYAFKGNMSLQADSSNKTRDLTLTLNNNAKILGTINLKKKPFENATFTIKNTTNKNDDYSEISNIINTGGKVTINVEENAAYKGAINATKEIDLNIKKNATYAGLFTSKSISGVGAGEALVTAEENAVFIGGLEASGSGVTRNDIVTDLTKRGKNIVATFTDATFLANNNGRFGAGSGTGIVNKTHGAYVNAKFTRSSMNGDIITSANNEGWSVNDISFASAAVNPTASGDSTPPKIDYAPANKAANKATEAAMVPTTTHKLDYYLPHLPSTGTNEALNQTAITKFYGALMTEAKLKGMSGDQIQGYVIAGIQDYLRLA